MADSKADAGRVQVEFGNFLADLGRRVAGADGVVDGATALALAEQALGGGRRAAALLHGFAVLLAYADSKPGATVLDDEEGATRAAHGAVLRLEEFKLQQRIDEAEAVAGTVTCPSPGCGAGAHSRGRISRVFLSQHGRLGLQLRKAVCVEPGCGTAILPGAKACGLTQHRFTPGCANAVTQLSTALAYGQAVTLLGQLLHIEVSEHAAQELTEERGATLLALDQAAAKEHAPYADSGLERACGRPADAVAADQAPEVAYLETDGVFPVKRELLPDESVEVPGARGGKGRKYKLEGAEVKNAVLYTAKAAVQEMPSRGCLLHKTYVSYLGHWMLFAPLLWLTMLRLRFDQAKLLVVLSDGAEWIRSLGTWLPMRGRVLLILDFYHAAHRAWEVARQLYGDRTDKCAAQARKWCGAIELGGVQYVIDELKELKVLNAERAKVAEAVADLVGYYEHNRDRMQYPEYTKRGLRISSGIVESANFHVTGARLKQQGMRWTEKAARELALLRADLCSERWAVRSRQLLAA